MLIHIVDAPIVAIDEFFEVCPTANGEGHRAGDSRFVCMRVKKRGGMRMTLFSMLLNSLLVGERFSRLVSELLCVFWWISVHRMRVPVLDMQEVIVFSAMRPQPWNDGCVDFISMFGSHFKGEGMNLVPSSKKPPGMMTIAEARKGDGLVASLAQITGEQWIGLAMTRAIWVFKMASPSPMAKCAMIDRKTSRDKACSRRDAGRGCAICPSKTHTLSSNRVDRRTCLPLVAITAQVIRPQ